MTTFLRREAEVVMLISCVRDRLAAGESVDDPALLEALIERGNARGTARQIAERLLSAAGGLAGLVGWPVARIAAEAGVPRRRAAAIVAALEVGRRVESAPWTPGVTLDHWEAVARHYRAKLRGTTQECFIVVLLDARRRLIRDVQVATGSLSQCVVEPREVFRLAIVEAAASIICVHPHPSGDCTPSAEDSVLTRRLEEAGTVLGIPLADHVVVAGGGGFSFAAHGLVSPAQ